MILCGSSLVALQLKWSIDVRKISGYNYFLQIDNDFH